MKKYVIYTSVTGAYDNLPEYDYIDERFDYLCFSNDYPEGEKVGQWKIKSIPINVAKSNIHLSRYPKLLPHKVLPEYEWSVWLDANLNIKSKEIYDKIIHNIDQNNKWCGIEHPGTHCIYKEIKVCLELGKVKFLNVLSIFKFLKKEKYPKNNGLFENNFILRKIHDKKIIEIDESWWKLFNRFIPRDQLSLFYLFWEKNFKPSLFLPKEINTHNSPMFGFKYHNKQKISKKINLKINIFINKLFLKITEKLNYF